jgi:hypothetical protein
MEGLDLTLYEHLGKDVEAINQREVFLVRVKALARQIEERVNELRDSAATISEEGSTVEEPPAHEWMGKNNVW